MKTKYGKPSKKKFETFCPSECFTLESGGSICSSKASKLENPSVLLDCSNWLSGNGKLNLNYIYSQSFYHADSHQSSF